MRRVASRSHLSPTRWVIPSVIPRIRWLKNGTVTFHVVSIFEQPTHFNHFLFIKINGYLYLRGFIHPWNTTPWYVLRGQCCPSSQKWKPSTDSNGSLAHFPGTGVTALCWQYKLFRSFQILKKCTKQPLLSAEGFRFQFRRSADLSHLLDQVTQQNSLQRAEEPYMQ